MRKAQFIKMLEIGKKSSLNCLLLKIIIIFMRQSEKNHLPNDPLIIRFGCSTKKKKAIAVTVKFV